jgi:hypothetical protein
MKHLYLFFSFLVFIARAQTTSCDSTYVVNEDLRNILGPLNKTQIPTGIIYEAVLPWARLDKFTGTASADTSNTIHFVQAYTELYNSKFNNTGMLHPVDLEDKLYAYNANPKTHHVIGIIDMDMAQIKSNAVDNNQLAVINDKLYDVPGRIGSPYETKRVFIALPLLAKGNDVFLTNTTHTFYLDTDFIFSNRGFDLNLYQYMDIEVNGVLVHREPIGGTLSNVTLKNAKVGSTQGLKKFFSAFFGVIPAAIKVVQVTIKFVKFVNAQGGDITNVKYAAHELENFTPCRARNQIAVVGDVYDAGYGEGAYGAAGRGYIFFGNGNCADQKVRKPIIFVDGFDPTNTRDVWEIFDTKINKILEIPNSISQTLGDTLIKDGFDIIVYDYDEMGSYNRGGAGLIENNGLAFAKFLDSLYARYSTTMQQDFIIVAPSMATMVARYALSWMETNNKPHHVNTLICFDGPNQGANLNVGTQQMVDLITQNLGVRIYKPARYGLHQSNAGKQMLLHHSSTNKEVITASPYRTKFLQNLAAVGNYPQNCRLVAMIDGNINGILKSTPQPLPNQLVIPGASILEAVVKNTETSEDEILNFKTFAQSSTSKSLSLDAVLSTKTKLFKIMKKDLYLTTYKRISKYINPLNSQSIDIAPGGNFGEKGSAEPGEKSLFQGAIDAFTKINKSFSIPQFKFFSACFMPSTSAIGYTFLNQSLSYYKNLSVDSLNRCAGTTPFDVVYAPTDTDLGHAENNFRIVNGFRSELYFPKAKRTCTTPTCPDYLTLNGTNSPSINQNLKAAKAIIILPKHEIPNGTVFKAQIGCGSITSVSSISKENPKSSVPVNQTQNTLPSCPFDWDPSLNSITCPSAGITNFTLYTNRNFPADTYPEFSIDGLNWFKPNVGDRAGAWSLLSGSSPQTFMVRLKNTPSQPVITQTLNYCNN